MMRAGKRIFLALVVLTFAAPAPGAQAAQNGWLEFFFPTLRDPDLDPARTLRAPFADTKPVPADAATGTTNETPGQLPENHVPLNIAHKNSEQVGEWLTGAVSEALTFTEADYTKALESRTPLFAEQGQTQYKAFLQQSNIIKILESRRFNVRGFVAQKPLLLNEGVVNGRYRWLFEMPVVVTYMDKTAKGYKDAKPDNQNLTLQLQAGRTANETDGKDIAIERWSGTAQTINME